MVYSFLHLPPFLSVFLLMLFLLERWAEEENREELEQVSEKRVGLQVLEFSQPCPKFLLSLLCSGGPGVRAQWNISDLVGVVGVHAYVYTCTSL